MSTGDDAGLTGDLARLHGWWQDRNPGASREVAWIVDQQDPDESIRAVNRAIDSGATLLVLHMNGDDARSRAAIALIADLPATAVIDQGPDTSDHQWMVEVAAVRDSLEPLRGLATPDAIASIYAPPARAAASALLAATARRTPVLFDGLDAYAGALLANRDESDAQWWWLPASSSPDPAITAAQDVMDAKPAAHLGTHGENPLALRAVLALLDVVDPA